jgi:hypothetical protein
MTKVKISITLDEQLAKEIDNHLRKLVVEAAKSGAAIPKQSNIYEEILAKGWELLKRETRK